MINVKEAKQLIIQYCKRAKVELRPLVEASGYVLADTVHSIIDTPPFNQSAMDGYAFSFEKWDGKSEMTLIGEVQAGNVFNKEIGQMEAVRIYTGASLPPGADTVVVQEKIFLSGKSIFIQDTQIVKGSNVRLKGSQTKKGKVTLQSGQQLTPAAISFLASTGVDKVKVYSKPTVSIIVTGKELIHPGDTISEGKVFESNSFGLIAALQQLYISPVSVIVVDDDEKEIMNAISSQLQSDLLILTGGVSVGDYDFVSFSLEKCGVKKIFHKVKQKPGKPFYFGKGEHTLVFALPGNPAAVLTCFYEYVVLAICIFTGINYLKKIKLPLANDFQKKSGLTYFMKGKSSSNEVEILDNQESYKMNSFALANCIVELDEDGEFYKKGDFVNIKMIL